MPSPKPLLLIAGFLGAGKTTLLRGLLSELSRNGIRADVILNDIANADLDAASLDPNEAASIAPLAASCACCDSLDELATLCGTAARSDGDLLVIELNGTADPLALLESFTLLEARLPFSPKLLVGVIDIRQWGARGELTPLERRQMNAAGLHVLSHTDQADGDELSRTRATISHTFPHSRQITAGQLADCLIQGTALSAAIPDGPGVREPTDHHQDDVHLLSHQVKGCQIPLPPKLRRSAIEGLLERLPAEVLRAKALVKLVEEPGTRWLFERSGDEVSPSPIPVPGITRLSPSLLCIGIRLDPEPIRRLVSDQFGYAPVGC